jgi:AhpC/TSA family
MKKILAVSTLILVFGCICAFFWYSEWQYNLPTPQPAQYKDVKPKEQINISSFSTSMGQKANRPLFIHFFNPDCPCSRFNMPHFKTLASTYGSRIDFAVVVMTDDKDHTESSIRKKYGINMPVLFDTSIATLCGVYSTPQAVLINTDQSLYYRGNYNKSRYCTDKKSNYAQMAIDSLLGSRGEPLFSKFALTAYGCSLPNCSK